jgi:hypothetical protein
VILVWVRGWAGYYRVSGLVAALQVVGDRPTAGGAPVADVGATEAEKATSHPRDVTFLLTNPITEALATKRHSTIRTPASPGSPLRLGVSTH